MDEMQQEFLDIVTQVRAHLEFQRALGVSVVETVAVSSSAIAVPPVVKPIAKIPAEPETKKSAAISGGLSAVRDELGDCTSASQGSSRSTRSVR